MTESRMWILYWQKRKSANEDFVVYAGDEVTFICNARNAYDVAVEYLTKLAADSPEGAFADFLCWNCNLSQSMRHLLRHTELLRNAVNQGKNS